MYMVLKLAYIKHFQLIFLSKDWQSLCIVAGWRLIHNVLGVCDAKEQF